MERETGFEPATSTLARLHSTTELFPPALTIIGNAGEAVKLGVLAALTLLPPQPASVRFCSIDYDGSAEASAEAEGEREMESRRVWAASSGGVGLM